MKHICVWVAFFFFGCCSVFPVVLFTNLFTGFELPLWSSQVTYGLCVEFEFLKHIEAGGREIKLGWPFSQWEILPCYWLSKIICLTLFVLGGWENQHWGCFNQQRYLSAKNMLCIMYAWCCFIDYYESKNICIHFIRCFGLSQSKLMYKDFI